MKCIHCGSNTPGRVARASGQCGACRHRYAFLGIDTYKVTDGLFQKAIDGVSGKDAFYFTERQLWYEFLRRLPAPPKIGCGAAAGTILLTPLWLMMAAGGAPAGGTKAPQIAIPFAQFKTSYLDRWIAIHGPITRLLPPPSLSVLASSPPPEVLAYSFDRALVVDSAEVAAMLVANRFHFENNCAILSFDRRYPTGSTFETVRSMLSRNPSLVVCALHDASLSGAFQATRLRAADWFPDFSTRIADLGLTPRQAWQNKLPALPGDPADVSQIPLPKDEADWLAAGNHAELAALRPARLMKTVYRSFARVSQALAEDRYWSDDGIWIMGYGYGPGNVWIYDTSGPDIWTPGPAGDIGDVGAPDSFG